MPLDRVGADGGPAWPRRIALVTHGLGPGGAERVVSVISRHWAAQGRTVSVVTVDDARRDVYDLAPGVERVALGLARDARNAFHGAILSVERISALRRAFDRLRPDAVVSFMPQTNVLALLACAGTRVPVVVCERTDPRHASLELQWRVLRRALYPTAAAVAVQTRSVAEWARAFCPRVHVIPNFVERPTCSASRITEDGPKQLIAMGRLIRAKGFDLLIEAFARIAPSHPEWTLTILGDGPERARLEALVERHGLRGKVSLPGRVSNPLDHLARSQLFALSSRHEGFPNALLEAMSCGVPVVAFDCPSGPADAIRPGHDGVLVPPGDVASMAAALGRLMEDPSERARLGRNASEIVERLGPDQVLPLWHHMLEGLARGT